jgi:hypothetical protein
MSEQNAPEHGGSMAKELMIKPNHEALSFLIIAMKEEAVIKHQKNRACGSKTHYALFF